MFSLTAVPTVRAHVKLFFLLLGLRVYASAGHALCGDVQACYMDSMYDEVDGWADSSGRLKTGQSGYVGGRQLTVA